MLLDRRIGLLKIRVFRPFPFEAVRKLLLGVPKVAVIDRNVSFGHHGIFYSELKSALYGQPNQPAVFGFIAGLGGRDITPRTIDEIINFTRDHDRPEQEIHWIGLKSGETARKLQPSEEREQVER